jgi:hypothetical protein
LKNNYSECWGANVEGEAARISIQPIWRPAPFSRVQDRHHPELHRSGAAKFLGFFPVVSSARNPIMLCFTRQDPRVLEELGDLNPLRLANPNPRPERLRHLVIGSPEGV